MHVDSKGNLSFHLKKWLLVFALVLAVFLIAVVGTTAWLRYIRSLQTVTMIRVADLSLEGPNEYTIAIDLGGIDVSHQSPAQYVFGVKSNITGNFWIQLGYTTNIPLTYRVYQTSENGSAHVTSGGSTFNYDPNSSLTGSFLNPNTANSSIAGTQLHNDTYDSFSRVQINAEPLYWQCGPIPTVDGETLYFILEISWGNLVNNKETDMIYLTVGTGGGVNSSEHGSGGSGS